MKSRANPHSVAAIARAARKARLTRQPFALSPRVTVTVEQQIVRGGRYPWKHVYYATVDGTRLGGYDRQDSFAAWLAGRLQVAS